ncbi:arrestin [Pleomassaria siparia CBS 279.74]|uniref:Arrestin n=1 Tax=Pleomassaria siparia CBS 279.74 TaxID=1314801 RepID=A0A6G1K2Y3_9PLEO|nr:arrestin [Pleomassaria siparia CBS 279.74]
MIVSISLEHPHTHYTNLDVIQGRVFLRIPNPTNISSIVVKLEGEAKTRLLAAIRPDRPERQKPVLEVHKLLYKTQVLWPANAPQDIATSKATYTLNAGQYEYPFHFKIPLNNSCQISNSLSTNVSFTNIVPEMAKTPTHHVKQTLPPSLNGFPGEAEIRYFVKVTVNRPQFFKENPRAFANFTMLPIEPPRPPQADGEAYARRQHQFLEDTASISAGKKKSLFDRSDSDRKGAVPNMPTSPTSGTPPRVTLDARLPNPAIVTCNQDVPLRVLVKNMSERKKNLYLQMLQIELIGYTKVRAHEVERTESNSWILASMSNMAIPLGSPTDPIGTEVPINPEYWQGKSIPNTVAPSFQTCNLSRHYELEVRVGIGYGSYEHGRDQLIVLPLRLPVKVYSGIAPPKALLEATLTGDAGKLKPAYLEPNAQVQPPYTPHTPTGSGFASASASPPAQVPYDDAPPSYEDAIGQDLPPINGYRGSYQPPPVPEGAPRFSDEKRR